MSPLAASLSLSVPSSLFLSLCVSSYPPDSSVCLRLPVCLSIALSFFLPLSLSLSLPLSLSLSLSVCLSLSVSLSLSLSLSVSLCLSLSLSLSLCLCLYRASISFSCLSCLSLFRLGPLPEALRAQHAEAEGPLSVCLEDYVLDGMPRQVHIHALGGPLGCGGPRGRALEGCLRQQTI